jgi:hypothetical protein
MPFAPYSTKGPYYYYPNGRIGQTKAGAKANKAAVTRLLNRRGVIESNTGKEINGVRTRNGQGIKFEDYAAFKASLGRLGVDLRGPRAPHMLQAIAIGANFERSVDDMMLALSDRPNPAHEVVIGIYGEEEGRASGHNEGVPGRLPRRHFLGASDAEQQAMVEDINERIKSRIKLAETLKT